MEDPPRKYFRLAPGREVRLKHAYYITCVDVVKDEQTGEITELHCTYDPETRGGWSEDGRRVRGTLHWVSAPHALEAEVRLFDHLFTEPNPNALTDDDFKANLNPNSLEVLQSCQVESSLDGAAQGTQYQFLRTGYFCVDPDSSDEKLVFNRTVTLRDTWAKIQRAQQRQ
jgi:glutaminyl-tRNA synthetase